MFEAMRESVSDKPWSNFSAADYNPDQWKRACLIDTEQGDPGSKDRYKIPVREPDGTLNRNGVHAAAGGHGIGAVSGVAADTKKAAAKKLVSLYRNQLKEDPPDSLLSLAGMSQSNSTEYDLKTCVRSVPFDLTNVDEHGDGLSFEGYAAVFNSPTRIDNWLEGTFDETILPGAFANSIRTTTPKFQFDHGRHPMIGSIPLGSVNQLREDQKGLFVQARLADNWLVQPVRDAIQNGSIDGMSFRFTVPDGGETWIEPKGKNDVPQRQLTQVDVPELGPVVFPAYDQTTAKVRSLLGLPAEEIVQDSGNTGASSRGVDDRGESVERERIRVMRNRLMIATGIIR